MALNNHVWRILALALAVASAGVFAQPGTSVDVAASEKPALQKWNKPLPALALKDLQGTARTLKDWRGKVVVVHFWATWCEPCVAELPALMRFKNEMRDQPFEVVTVNLGEADTRIRDFYRKLDVEFITLLDRDGDAKKQWQVGGVPMSFVLSGDGRPRYRYFGEIDWASADVRALLAPLLRAARSTKPASAVVAETRGAG